MPGAAAPEVLITSLALFRKVEELADALRPEDFVRPTKDEPAGSVILGDAADTMKRLFTLVDKLRRERTEKPGEVAMLDGVIHLAMIYEVWQHFGITSEHIGFNSAWQVFSTGAR